MRVSIEFQLPEEREDHHDALNGRYYRAIICKLEDWLRGLTKHKDEELVTIQEVRDKIREFSDNYDVKL